MPATDRRILKLALPALGSLAVEPLYVLTDTAIVGRLGTAQLAGLAIAASVLGIVFGGANFLTYGATERVARRIGAGDRAGAADVGVQTIWLAALVGVTVAPLLAALAGPICAAFGADGDVLEHGSPTGERRLRHCEEKHQRHYDHQDIESRRNSSCRIETSPRPVRAGCGFAQSLAR